MCDQEEKKEEEGSGSDDTTRYIKMLIIMIAAANNIHAMPFWFVSSSSAHELSTHTEPPHLADATSDDDQTNDQYMSLNPAAMDYESMYTKSSGWLTRGESGAV